MISVSTTGNFDRTKDFINRMIHREEYLNLDRYGRMGVEALSRYTPRETGETAQSWSYKVKRDKNIVAIEWYNSHVNHGVNVAVLIQYGHGTGTGGYVHGVDYINPAIRPIFDQIAEDVWRAVMRA